MKNKKKGIVTIIISLILLATSYILYAFLKIDDVFCVLLMIISLIIGLYGIYQVIRDTYK